MTASSAFHWFFGCHHQDRSRVFTIEKRTYQICLDCGHEITYLWEQMGALKPSTASGSGRPVGQ
jgi:hypothetical protein